MKDYSFQIELTQLGLTVQNKEIDLLLSSIAIFRIKNYKI